MKLRHRIPDEAFRSATVSADYEAEVQRTLARAQIKYEHAQNQLAAAERRLARAQSRPASKGKRERQRSREIEELIALVELRRMDLLRLQGLMQSHAAAARFRGTKSYRNVPTPHTI